MSLRIHHWLALVFLLIAAGLFIGGYPMPVFEYHERVATLKLTLERYGACFLVLALLVLELRIGQPIVVPGRKRLLAYGLGSVLAFAGLLIDALLRDIDRGIVTNVTELGPTIVLLIVIELALLLMLSAFLIRAALGVENAGILLRVLAFVFELMALVIALCALVGGDYVVLATAGGLALFFWYFLLGSHEKARR